MPTTLEALGIDRLSVDDRLRLIELIWDSLPRTLDRGEVPDWHAAEVGKRRADAAARPGEGRPWREVLAELQGAE